MSRNPAGTARRERNRRKDPVRLGGIRGLLAVLATVSIPAVSATAEPTTDSTTDSTTLAPAEPIAGSPAARSMEAPPKEARRNAVHLFGAQMASNKWTEIALVDNVEMRDAYLVGIGVSREIWGGRDWAIEAEGQAVKHFARQDHWEFNAALISRWRRFPWNEWVPTSVAFGIGPSYATVVPPEEVANDGQSAKFLLYWMAELELGIPGQPWSAITRLHHRSAAYGVFAEDGGSNWLTLGLRYRF